MVVFGLCGWYFYFLGINFLKFEEVINQKVVYVNVNDKEKKSKK